LIVRRGLFEVIRGSRTQLATPNTGVCFQEGEEYRVGHPLGQGDDCTLIRLEEESLTELVERTGTGRTWQRGLLTLRPGRWLSLHWRLLAALRRGEVGALEIEEETLLAIAADFTRPLRLHALAARVHSSPYHLSRVFRHWTGMPIHAHVTQLRVREALVRLEEGERDLTRLALELGFCESSHLARAFRKTVGCSPSAAREGRWPGPRN